MLGTYCRYGRILFVYGKDLCEFLLFTIRKCAARWNICSFGSSFTVLVLLSSGFVNVFCEVNKMANAKSLPESWPTLWFLSPKLCFSEKIRYSLEKRNTFYLMVVELLRSQYGRKCGSCLFCDNGGGFHSYAKGNLLCSSFVDFMLLPFRVRLSYSFS